MRLTHELGFFNDCSIDRDTGSSGIDFSRSSNSVDFEICRIGDIVNCRKWDEVYR